MSTYHFIWIFILNACTYIYIYKLRIFYCASVSYLCHVYRRCCWDVDKFTTGVIDTGNTFTLVINLPLVSMTPVINLALVSTTLVIGGRICVWFITGVVNTGNKTWNRNISEYVHKNSKSLWLHNQGPRGSRFMKNTRSKKNRVRVSSSVILVFELLTEGLSESFKGSIRLDELGGWE